MIEIATELNILLQQYQYQQCHLRLLLLTHNLRQPLSSLAAKVVDVFLTPNEKFQEVTIAHISTALNSYHKC